MPAPRAYTVLRAQYCRRMPTTTVAAIITEPSDRAAVLLTRRNIRPFQGQWCIPGGHIDRYEQVHDAVVREVKEETGLDFDARFFRYFDELIPHQQIHAVVMVFVGVGHGTIRPDDNEVSEVRWFALEEAAELPLAFTHNEVLDVYGRSLGS